MSGNIVLTSTANSWYQKQFQQSLPAEEKRLRQRRIHRDALLDVGTSPWRKLFYSYNNQSLITVTGVDHETFEYLLQKFKPYFDQFTPFGDMDDEIEKHKKLGQRQAVTAVDGLGIVLAWTRTRGSVYFLQIQFGMSMTNLCMYLWFGHRIIVEMLQGDEYAGIAIWSPEKLVNTRQQ